MDPLVKNVVYVMLWHLVFFFCSPLGTSKNLSAHPIGDIFVLVTLSHLTGSFFISQCRMHVGCAFAPGIHHLVGLGVKVSTSTVADLGFDFRFLCGDFLS